MRHVQGILAPIVVIGGLLFGLASAGAEASTQGNQPILQGLWLTTDYPSITERLGEDIQLSLTLRNMNLPPARAEFTVEGLPNGWTAEFDGSGKPITAAMVEPNDTSRLTLKLSPPKDAKTGSYPMHILGKTGETNLDLPVTIVLAEPKPANVKLEPKLPALRGTPHSSFDFQVSVKNDSADDQTFNLLSQAPAGFQVVFEEQYGTQELTSIPLKAGESKDIKVSVKPPQDVSAGQYQVAVRAASPKVSADTRLLLDVTGQPSLALAGPDGRLSGDATAGRDRTFPLTLHNSGTAPARAIKLDASAPSGWKVTFAPATVDVIAPNQDVPVTADMTPSDKAIAGDYVVGLRADGEGASANAEFRVTVLTSTVWGAAGLGVIGAAVIVLVLAVTRYGRR
jgi:uncharacterized membrane protein